MRIVTRSSKPQYLSYVFLRKIFGVGWLWLETEYFNHDELHRYAEENRIHPRNLMNIGAGKLGDSPNHAQQVDAPGGYSRPVQPVDYLLQVVLEQV